MPDPRSSRTNPTNPSTGFGAGFGAGFRAGMMAAQTPTGPELAEPEPVAQRSLATYDILGHTLVATLMVGALSGPDAIDLAAELYVTIFGPEEAERPPTGIKHVVLDLQNVQYMDSTCVGVLVELLTRLREAGGGIALANVAQNVEYLFKLTRLDRVFPVCRDVMKAIEVVERAAA